METNTIFFNSFDTLNQKLNYNKMKIKFIFKASTLRINQNQNEKLTRVLLLTRKKFVDKQYKAIIYIIKNFEILRLNFR